MKIRFGLAALTFGVAAIAVVAAAPSAHADYACCFNNGSCLEKPDEASCCDLGGTFFTGTLCSEVDCGHGVTANCSPGYYKNHAEEWCSSNPGFPGSNLSRNCASGADCGTLLAQLQARGAGSEAIRNSAKAVLDACFGTGADSPCEED
jgi:hypothetical protein